MPGLRKMNIANAESVFDQNEYDILILRHILDNKDVPSYIFTKNIFFSFFSKIMVFVRMNPH